MGPPLPPASRPVHPLVAVGSYRIERLLGVGSFATVWLGYDPSIGARVAIKVLAENWSHDLRVRERFLDEARILWRLDHERLIRVHAFGELDDGRPYLVMAWADRGSLRERLAARALSLPDGVQLLREIAAGVSVLHDNGIVHRDLTPDNVLFRSKPSGERLADTTEDVVIADLGLAKNVAAVSGFTARAGTPGYMAPEQDDPLAVVDARTDVFSLGRLAADVLAAEPAPAVADPASGERGRDRRALRARLAQVVRTATAVHPSDRYSDAREFLAALDSARPSQPRRRRHPVRRRMAAALVAAGLVIAAGVAAAVSWPRGAVQANSDRTGRITVALPAGWRAQGTGWAGQYSSDGELEPALVMSPDPNRWATDPAVPGAFVGLSTTLVTHTTPARFVAEHAHVGCAASPVRTTTLASIDWVIAEFTSCRNGKPAIVEAAGLVSAGSGLIYVQIAPPAGSGAAFTDSLLAGVRITR